MKFDEGQKSWRGLHNGVKKGKQLTCPPANPQKKLVAKLAARLADWERSFSIPKPGLCGRQKPGSIKHR